MTARATGGGVYGALAHVPSATPVDSRLRGNDEQAFVLSFPRRRESIGVRRSRLPEHRTHQASTHSPSLPRRRESIDSALDIPLELVSRSRMRRQGARPDASVAAVTAGPRPAGSGTVWIVVVSCVIEVPPPEFHRFEAAGPRDGLVRRPGSARAVPWPQAEAGTTVNQEDTAGGRTLGGTDLVQPDPIAHVSGTSPPVSGRRRCRRARRSGGCARSPYGLLMSSPHFSPSHGCGRGSDCFRCVERGQGARRTYGYACAP